MEGLGANLALAFIITVVVFGLWMLKIKLVDKAQSFINKVKANRLETSKNELA